MKPIAHDKKVTASLDALKTQRQRLRDAVNNKRGYNRVRTAFVHYDGAVDELITSIFEFVESEVIRMHNEKEEFIRDASFEIDKKAPVRRDNQNLFVGFIVGMMLGVIAAGLLV